jgi:hypothetical protein
MGAFGGLDLIKSGLVFGFDIGNPVANNSTFTRFYKGEPTTNLSYNNGQTDSQYLASTITWVNAGSWTSNTNETDVSKPIIPELDTTNLRITSGLNTTAGGSIHYGCGFTTVNPSTTYTISVWYRQNKANISQPYLRTNVTNVSLGNLAYNGDTNSANWPVNTWIRISATGTTASNENGIYISNYIGTSVGDKIWYFGHQVEAKSRMTPLITGTRSATNSLIDLTKSSSIDVSNISFDSSALPTFDGTNDYINIPSSTVFDTQTVTVEVIVKPNGLNQYGFWFEKGAVNTQYSLFMEGTNIVWRQASGTSYNSQYTATSTMTNNAWNHVVGTFKTGERITYVNGTARTSDSLSYTLNTNQGNQFIGSYNSGAYYYNGQIAVVRVYNRVLLATEIARNFKVYQKRFNIQ